MKKEDLNRVVNFLKKTLETLDAAHVEDYRIVSRYAEYLVAQKLSEEGHEVQIGNEREDKKADIFLPKKDTGFRVEVKSGKIEESNEFGTVKYATASFGKGTQIDDKKFDFCVFVTFDKHTPEEFLIFTLEELIEGEAAKKRKNAPSFSKTNPCILFRFNNLKKLNNHMKRWDDYSLKIEIDLHRRPEKYVDRWDKINKIS